MQCFKKTSTKQVLAAFLLVSTYLISEAKIVKKDDYDCEDEDTTDPCMDCEIKKMTASELMLSDATKKFFGVEDNLKSTKHKDKLQVFHCKCVQLSGGPFLKGTFDEKDEFDEFVDDDDDEIDWKKSEVLKISDCNELDMTLDAAFQEEMGISESKQTILMVENISKLKMDFSMGDASDGRFTSVSFRNVTFSDEEDSKLDFELEKTDDAIELIFDTIKITKGTFIIEQQNSNTDENSNQLSVDPTLMILNSTIGSEVDIEEITTNGLDFKIAVANVQKDKDCLKKQANDDTDDEDDCGDFCFFDYMGKVKINQNRFTYLGTEAIAILNAKMFEFYGNTVEFTMDSALHLANVKNLNISENRFQFIGKTPAFQIIYKYSATGLKDFEYFPSNLPNGMDEDNFEDQCDDEDNAKFASMKADQIDKVNITKNLFGKLQKETIKYKIDEKYEKEFAVKRFTAEGNSNRKPCKCPIEEIDKDADINVNLTMRALNMQKCLSPLHPPVLGKREDICEGRYPRSAAEKLEDAQKGIKPWHLVLAILLSIIVTAVVVFVIVRFCCMSDEIKSRTVSPIP